MLIFFESTSAPLAVQSMEHNIFIYILMSMTVFLVGSGFSRIGYLRARFKEFNFWEVSPAFESLGLY
jgi:hypothetical protein